MFFSRSIADNRDFNASSLESRQRSLRRARMRENVKKGLCHNQDAIVRRAICHSGSVYFSTLVIAAENQQAHGPA